MSLPVMQSSWQWWLILPVTSASVLVAYCPPKASRHFMNREFLSMRKPPSPGVTRKLKGRKWSTLVLSPLEEKKSALSSYSSSCCLKMSEASLCFSFTCKSRWHPTLGTRLLCLKIPPFPSHINQIDIRLARSCVSFFGGLCLLSTLIGFHVCI